MKVIAVTAAEGHRSNNKATHGPAVKQAASNGCLLRVRAKIREEKGKGVFKFKLKGAERP